MTMLHVSDATFTQQLNPHGVTVVDFGAPWCPPCKALLPILDELNAQYGSKAPILKVNVDDSPEISAQYGIMSLPTVMFFKDAKPVDKLIGLRPKTAYANIIDKHLDA